MALLVAYFSCTHSSSTRCLDIRSAIDTMPHQLSVFRARLPSLLSACCSGSTAETVSRTAPCSVVVTHRQEREWVSFSAGEIDLNRILVAHDFSTHSELALKYGVSLAQEYQAELHLLHVLSKEER